MKFLIKLTLSLILILYLAILTKLILFKYIPLTEMIHNFNFSHREYLWRDNNVVPFKTIRFYLFRADVNINIIIQNLAGNILGFVPLGFLLPLISKKYLKFSAVFLAGFNLSLTYEILQLLLELGSFDIDDLILNTFGTILGYLLVIIYKKVKRGAK